MKFLIAPLKTLTLIGRFFPVQCTFIDGFRNNFQDHSRVSEQLFRNTGGYQKAGTSSQKRVTGRNFTIGKIS
jgi:hypothetical protein